MKKEILFRGKDLSGIMNHSWFYGSLDLSFNPEFPRIICKDRFDNTMYIEVDKETVGQYTGLKDKNGIKIFEGDIVIWENIDDFEKVHKSSAFEIIFDDKYFYCYVASKDFGKGCVLQFNFNDIRNKHIKVIGNIYDNPDLLEKKENE